MADFAPYQNSPETERALSPPPPGRSASRSPQPPKSPPPNRLNFSAALPPPSQFADDDDDNNDGGRRRGVGTGYVRTGGYQGGYQDIPSSGAAGVGGGAGDSLLESGRLDVNLFETSLPMRMDFEAMLAYLLLPPAGGVLLLIIEHKSDYVRYVLFFSPFFPFSKKTFSFCWKKFFFASGLSTYYLIPTISQKKRKKKLIAKQFLRIFATTNSFHAYQSSLLFTALFLLHLLLSFSSILSWLFFTFDMLLILFLAWHAYKDADLLDRYEIPFFGRLASDFVDAE